MVYMSWLLRIGYGVGQLPEGIKSAAFGFYLLFYYNQIMGLSGTLVGAALFIALMFDAITDPLVGSWSDSTRSIFGRRHPFMYIAALPFACSFYFLFAPPENLGSFGLFMWVLIFSIITRSAMTLYSVPYMALGAELTRDYDERTLLSALRSVFQLVGMFLVLIVANELYFGATADYPDGRLNPAAYQNLALAGAPLMILGILIAAGATHSQIPKLRKPNAAALSLSRIMSEVVMAFQIPSFTALVCASILFGITQGMVQALILYTGTYFFELSGTQIRFLFAFAISGIVIGNMLSRVFFYIIKEKKTLYIAGLSWYAFFTSSVIILKLFDLLPFSSQEEVAALYIASGFISALGLGVAIPLTGSMIADITDEHELRHGDRQEGIYYAAASFAGKAVGGIGPVFAGIIIDLSGITPGTSPEDISPEALARFGWAQGPSVIFLTALSVIAISYYSISREKHSRTIDEIKLRARNQASSD
ncbi:MAG: GPH family glycoside/pentoside/hexuronide:cation symporter [Flavobacterium sp.]|jgi:GPH family glycoside/pentoside/hexuronide:cation symporter